MHVFPTSISFCSMKRDTRNYDLIIIHYIWCLFSVSEVFSQAIRLLSSLNKINNVLFTKMCQLYIVAFRCLRFECRLCHNFKQYGKSSIKVDNPCVLRKHHVREFLSMFLKKFCACLWEKFLYARMCLAKKVRKSWGSISNRSQPLYKTLLPFASWNIQTIR